jgi:uncharacterized protein YkwD
MIHLFIPDLIRKERSFLLKHHSLIAYSVIGISILAFNFLLTHSSSNILGYATNINNEDLLTYTNLRRQNEGLPNLTYNEKLSQAAAEKAKNMFQENYWAHVSPSGIEPWYFIKQAEYEYLYAGENLAVDFSDSTDVVEAWYNSPSHRENLLSSNFSDIGFAVANGELKGRKTTIVVQMFGSPLNKDLATKIESDNEIVTPKATVPTPNVDAAAQQFEEHTGAVLNASTVFDASKYIAMALGAFLLILLFLDGYYARIHNLNRISGHTLLHVVVLTFVLASIWYTSTGIIL